LRMEKDKNVEARPNTRTANTFLRGCLTLGAVDEAAALLERMENEWSKDETWCNNHGGAPDASSYEMVVSLLCQALRYKQASAAANRCLERLGTSPGCASMFVAVARAAAVCKAKKAADKATTQARQVLGEEENLGSDDEQVNSEVVGSGGKRGMVKAVEAGNEDDEEIAKKKEAARARSLQVFQSHRHADLVAELKSIAKSVNKERPIDLQWLWSRTVIVEDHTDYNANTEEEAPPGNKGEKRGKEKGPPDEKLVKALCKRLLVFGLREKGPDADVAGKIFKGAVRGGHSGAKKLSKFLTKLRKKEGKKINDQNNGAADGKPKIDLAALFRPLEGNDKQRPLHLEICSGVGEWICSQAVRDKSACWVACELRFDRSARCFQRLALHGLATHHGNAGLVVGNACHALENCLQPSSCKCLFINHPEPPSLTELTPAAADDNKEVEGEATERPATHMVTASFLHKGCATVLQPGGILTICTDSWEYGEWLLKTVTSPDLAEVFEDALDGTPASKQKRLAKAGRVGLRGEPPPVEVCGAEYRGKAGASYFQRLKKSEKSFRGIVGEEAEQRYFLCLRRRDTVPAPQNKETPRRDDCSQETLREQAKKTSKKKKSHGKAGGQETPHHEQAKKTNEKKKRHREASGEETPRREEKNRHGKAGGQETGDQETPRREQVKKRKGKRQREAAKRWKEKNG